MAQPPSTFAGHAREGDIVGTFRLALINGSLWAIALSWADTIRLVVHTLFARESVREVADDILATGVTTLLGVGFALLVARRWCGARRRRAATAAAAARPPPQRRLATVIARRGA